jgi:hypothetical protein
VNTEGVWNDSVVQKWQWRSRGECLGYSLGMYEEGEYIFSNQSRFSQDVRVVLYLNTPGPVNGGCESLAAFDCVLQAARL